METQPPRLTKAFKKASVLNITQGFSAKHPAIDIVSIYGTPLVAPENIKVIGLWGNEALSLSTEGLQRGYGIKMQGVESGLIHVYWHCQPIFPVRLDDLVLRGRLWPIWANQGKCTNRVSSYLSQRTPQPQIKAHTCTRSFTCRHIRL